MFAESVSENWQIKENCQEYLKQVGKNNMIYTIGDFVIRLKNAVAARRKTVSAPHAKIIKNIATLLAKEGYVKNVKEIEEDGKKIVTAEIVYDKRMPIFTDVRVISKPSLRAYTTKVTLENIQKKALGIIVVSTNQGLMIGREALKKGLGGEILFEIW